MILNTKTQLQDLFTVKGRTQISPNNVKVKVLVTVSRPYLVTGLKISVITGLSYPFVSNSLKLSCRDFITYPNAVVVSRTAVEWRAPPLPATPQVSGIYVKQASNSSIKRGVLALPFSVLKLGTRNRPVNIWAHV